MEHTNPQQRVFFLVNINRFIIIICCNAQTSYMSIKYMIKYLCYSVIVQGFLNYLTLSQPQVNDSIIL